MVIERKVVACIGIVALLFSGASGVCAAQAPKRVSKELIQYVRDASRLGLSAVQIEKHATAAGWPSADVREALTAVRNVPAGSATASDASSGQSAEPAAGEEIPRPGAEEYHVGAGDVLQISVWKEPEASVGATVVRPDGKIGLPLLKEVEVVGLTPRQIEKIITDGLSKFIPAADVTVVVSAINSKKIYLVGAVKKEGPIPYTYRMTVMQALSEAGGLNDYAKRRKIYVLRTQNGKDYRLPFDYDAVLKGERMELNVPLLSGDTVVVPH